MFIFSYSISWFTTRIIFFMKEMQPSRLPPPSPHPIRTSPIRHGKRFSSLTVPEEHREAAVKEAAGTEINYASLHWFCITIILLVCAVEPYCCTFFLQRIKGRMVQQGQVLAGQSPCLWILLVRIIFPLWSQNSCTRKKMTMPFVWKSQESWKI